MLCILLHPFFALLKKIRHGIRSFWVSCSKAGTQSICSVYVHLSVHGGEVAESTRACSSAATHRRMTASASRAPFRGSSHRTRTPGSGGASRQARMATYTHPFSLHSYIIRLEDSRATRYVTDLVLEGPIEEAGFVPRRVAAENAPHLRAPVPFGESSVRAKEPP